MAPLQLPERLTKESLHGVQSAIAELQSESQLFQGFVDEMLDEMEAMRLQLTDQETRLSLEREEIATRREEIERLSGDMAEQQRETDELRERLTDSHEQLKAAQKELDEAIRQRNSLQHDVDASEELYAELNGKIDQMRDRCDDLEDRYRKSEAECLQLEQRVKDAEERANRSEATVKRLTHERDENRTQLDAAVAELSGMADILEAMQQAQAKFESTRENLQKTRDDLRAQLKSKQDEHVREMAVVESAKSDLERELQEARHRIEDLTTELQAQKELVDAQKLTWSAEMRQLRDALNRRTSVLEKSQTDFPRYMDESAEAGESDWVYGGDFAVKEVAAEQDEMDAPDEEETRPANANPVVGSVLARFSQFRNTESDEVGEE
ncbi:MAG: hypothetical protein R3E01_16625 [Pirellulaceae bacterium]|nr:hypothetical protein [Planctomycetales bacterium]